ncbi:two-component system C4-dicarboxylate transport sensor histidine kinase DctB [Variovorax boronicumulans]|uniref:C4-dicarboxylate transport sensor protein DctB n=1 Tax=Variovorax boronicumulans TaxID=436515 RepID=A0AAW8D7M7_9BURK|nr:ATP-binding protein [Variovorax boronicumulans]MDP9895861.1 two-component system C4-dicarboxylate transport sensor histidine kinase DctB [Variovorax boronicumulans]MDQ0055901.1 two-component system C4-dicarboxylate transport sensor histidine kinase DctB [Variovorax boronicumulans]
MPSHTPRRWRGLPRWLGALALVAVAAFAGHHVAMQTGLARLRDAADHRLDMLATGLDADLARFEYLPALLEMTPIVPALLGTPSDGALRDAVNRYLNGVNAAAGAEMLYVLDAGGTSLAASDWDRPGTTVGQDFSFRPYVIDALGQGRGRFYGVGITSRKPGYYLSYALRRDQPTRGVVAVKVNLEEAERAWRKLPGDVVLIDQRGVVILATREDIKFRPMLPLDGLQRAEVQRSRPYGEAALRPLQWAQKEALARDVQVITLDGLDQLASTRKLRGAPWQLVVLDDLAPVRVGARNAAITASLAMAVLLLVAIALWQRRRAVRQKLATQAALQAAHDTLESTVVARTAQLRAAQGELLHAGKMAALGQMSTGVVHELNQPLTAMRTLSESAGILLDKNRLDDVRGNLQRIRSMVDRLARLTSQLKTFAHKSELPLAAVPMARAIADAQVIVAEATKKNAIAIEVDVQPASLSVMAEEAALGSVLVNLMRNAIDAMQDSPSRTLRIEARPREGRVILRVSDTGPGIPQDILPRLFEPFVTSKPAGTGLGLGLVISAQLVRAMDGTLRAANQPEGGASFVVDLPAAVQNILIPPPQE